VYHILYTTVSGDFVTIEKEFPSFAAVERWLRSIGAAYWEIGLPARKKTLDFEFQRRGDVTSENPSAAGLG